MGDLQKSLPYKTISKLTQSFISSIQQRHSWWYEWSSWK